jgi:amino acid adenylation domain-containing protein
MSGFQGTGYEGLIYDLPVDCIHGVFERQVNDRPDRVAIEYAGAWISYGDLNARANQLAGFLRSTGAQPGAVVGVHLCRGIDMVVAVLAVLKTGAAYVMLDPAYPVPRLRTVIEDSGVQLVLGVLPYPGLWQDRKYICMQAEAGRIASHSAQNLSVFPPSASAACVMFTSGSSGRPKGAIVSHQAMLASFMGQDFLDLSSAHTWLQFSPVSWDIFALELFGALLFGGRCVLQPGQKPDPPAIAKLTVERDIDTLWFPSGLLSVMLDEYPDMFSRVKQIIFGGEAPSQSDVLAAHRRFPAIRMVTGYGSVEASLFETYHVVSADDFGRPGIPAGRPTANTRGYILDEFLNPVRPGAAGELYVASRGMADGYIGRPALTAWRFVADPFRGAGVRMYQTGDLARLGEDGSLVLLGRSDEQVKIRGFRIELAEIEFALCQNPAVRQAIALVRQGESGAKQIVMYVLPAARVEEGDLLDHARSRLPDYLVPDRIILVDSWPLTPNGKIDRAALPLPVAVASGDDRPPRNDREKMLCEMFARMLNTHEVGVDDNFFELGGDSLLALRLLNQIQTEFGVTVNSSELYEAPTASKLAPLLKQAGPARPKVRRMRETGT